MKPFVKVQCEDCGPSMISDPDQLSVFYLFEVIGEGPIYTMVFRCNYCNRPITEEVPESLVHKLRDNGVRVFDWLTGEVEIERV